MEIKDRLRIIIKREELSQKDFAQKCGIKPATLNHVLQGRNNASPDIINKVLDHFPSYRRDWLLSGEGSMLTAEAAERELTSRNVALFPDLVADLTREESKAEGKSVTPPEPPKTEALPKTSKNARPPVQTRRIEKIIVYYDDNTFEVLLPS